MSDQFFGLSWLALNAVDVPTLPGMPQGPIMTPEGITGDRGLTIDLPSPSRAGAPPFSPGAFSPAHVDFPPRLAADVHSSVSDSLPTRVIAEHPMDTSRSSSARRLCTGEELLRTSLGIQAIGSRALSDRANVDGGRSIKVSGPRLLGSSYMLCFRL